MDVLSWLYKTSQSPWIPSVNQLIHTTDLVSPFYDEKALRTLEPDFLRQVASVNEPQLCEACKTLGWHHLRKQPEPQVHLLNCPSFSKRLENAGCVLVLRCVSSRAPA